MILVVVEHSSGKMSKSTLEMVTAARGIGREGPITLLVLGSGVGSVAEQSALFADQVLVVGQARTGAIRSGGLGQRGCPDCPAGRGRHGSHRRQSQWARVQPPRRGQAGRGFDRRCDQPSRPQWCACRRALHISCSRDRDGRGRKPGHCGHGEAGCVCSSPGIR